MKDIDRTITGKRTEAQSARVTPEPWTDQAPGRVIDGRFEVLELLGHGGMGQVLKVRDAELDRTCALKVLLPEHSARPDFIKRMKHEVKNCQLLRHDGIVQVFDFCNDAQTGQAYFSMELVEGRSLRKWLDDRRGAPAPLDRVAAITSALIDALEYAHGRGVVHLDLKPENVMVTHDDDVRVLDFGISRALGGDVRTTMLKGAGTHYYMPPEQERGARDVGPPADAYALGVLLYELATGVAPRGNFGPPHEQRGELPRAWSEALMLAMLPDPAQRPPLRELRMPTPHPRGAAEQRDTDAPRRPRPKERPQPTRPTDRRALRAEEAPTRRAEAHDPPRATRPEARRPDPAAAPLSSAEVEAMVRRADALRLGAGAAQDARRAFDLYRAAAERGHAEAQWRVGFCLQHGDGVKKDAAAALQWHQAAADAGHAAAQGALGDAYFYGRAVRADKAKGLRWWRASAERGASYAACKLGDALLAGDGVSPDARRAFDYYTQSARGGYDVAQCKLGRCYELGRGVARAVDLALMHYSAAAAQGNDEARRHINRLQRTDALADTTDPAEAPEASNMPRLEHQRRPWTEIRWAKAKTDAATFYRHAVDAGSSDAAIKLGYAYANGHGMPADLKEAARLYKLAADQGDAHGLFLLGEATLRGSGVRADRDGALTLLKQARQRGHTEAARVLREHLEEG